METMERGRPHSRRTLLRGAAGGALALTALRVGGTAGALAQATPTTDAYPTATFTASEYQFTGPTQLGAGLNRLTLANHGQMGHHGMLLKFNSGKGAADLGPALKQGLGALFAIADAVGGPGGIDPGGTSSAILDLAAGDYALICVIPGPDGIPHAAKGMVLPLSVAGAANGSSAPTAAQTIELADFKFAMLPATVAAGTQVWQVTNKGAQLHEMQIFKLNPGVTAAQVAAMLGGPAPAASPMTGMASPVASPAAAAPAGPPPFSAVGGLAPMGPGHRAWAELDLAAGDYAAICFVPDIATGKPHFALGMLMPFTAS